MTGTAAPVARETSSATTAGLLREGLLRTADASMYQDKQRPASRTPAR